MQLIFNLFISLLMPNLVDSYIRRDDEPVICIAETDNGCRTQLEKKNAMYYKIPTNFPPLSDVLKNYSEECQNVMVCIIRRSNLFLL